MKLELALFVLILASMAVVGCAPAPSTSAASDWRQKVKEALPVYGHRNWIVIADSAYPAQSRAGIETVVSGAEHTAVVQEVLAAVAAAKHVRPIVYTDQELKFVPESDAPGIDAYRQKLDQLLQGRAVSVMEHEKIIAMLDQAAQTFRVLIVKTNLTLPYTSVFLQLDCGYWSADAEQRLRKAMAAPGK